jgi:hypothetical protein
MNNKKAKQIREIIPPVDEISRRNYRRAKKKYNKLSEDAKPIFLENLKNLFNSHTIYKLLDSLLH